MEHYITGVQIDKVRHLQNIKIKLSTDNRQHLLLTGKNGSGKTSVLEAIRKYLQAINDGQLHSLDTTFVTVLNNAEKKYDKASSDAEKFSAQKDIEYYKKLIVKYKDGIEIDFSGRDDLDFLYAQGLFITAYFPANRRSEIARVHGAEDVRLEERYGLSAEPAKLLLKYMVHLKTQQAYAKNENDVSVEQRIQAWFDRFESALKALLDEPSVKLKYDYVNYDFKLHIEGREPFSFDELSDGYSALIRIVADLILRMDKNWLRKETISAYDMEGIVLIDELETHLHTELQRKILPFLTGFFPRVQFIVSTHSAYILNSIDNVCIYDLEKQAQFGDFSNYSADDIAEGYFDTEAYSEKLREKVERYRELVNSKAVSEDARAERARLRVELQNVSGTFAKEIRDEFDCIEKRRKENGQV